MKKRAFIYAEAKRTYSRTYGGSTYTLNVYEITGGQLVRIGEVTACTRAHKGEASEAWGVVLKKCPEIRPMLIRRAKAAKNAYLLKEASEGSYHSWRFQELGVSLKEA